MAISKKITASSIKELKPEDQRLNDTEIPGFHARITPNGKITYYLFYRLNGKQANFKLGSHGELSPAQARDFAKEKAGEVAKGLDIQSKKKEIKRQTETERYTRLDVFLEKKYLPYLQSRNPKTADTIYKTITSVFDFLLERQLSDITPWDLEKWRTEQRKSDLSPTTCNYYINTLKGAMSRAVEWGLIERHDLGKVKALKNDNAIVRFLSQDEEKRLREALAIRNQRNKDERTSGNKFREERGYETLLDLSNFRFVDHLEPIVLLAMNTGMRRGELFGLKWSEVQLSQQFLTVHASNAKSGKGRHIPLNKEAFSVLSDWKEQGFSSTYVFEGEKDKPLTDIKKAWNKLLEDAQIHNFRFHDLRHHFASKLVMAGVDLNTVRELLGHSDLKMTLRYAHLAPEHKAAAVNLIG